MIILEKEIIDNTVYYTVNSNNKFYWIVKNKNKIYDIRPSNNYVVNFSGDIKKYIDAQKEEYNYTPYLFKNHPVKKNINVISISENPHETNYFKNHKMIYDLNIDITGKVTANVYYPNKNKGGYSFNLSEDDFNLLKGIVNKISIDSIGQNFFVNNNYFGQVIVLNDKYILNDYDKMKSKLDIQAVIMFSNLITMKYIPEQKATNKIYKVKSSEYAKMYKPEPLAPSTSK